MLKYINMNEMWSQIPKISLNDCLLYEIDVN